MNKEKREPAYTIRIWRNGEMVKQYEPTTRTEALKLWAEWNSVDECGPELLVDGEHIPWARANRMLRYRGSAVKMGVII